MNRLTRPVILLSAALLAGHSGYAADTNSDATRSLERRVRRELAMLPFHGVFDNMAFQIRGGTVTLTGKVTRPSLRSDAEGVLKPIEGIDAIENKIETLPLSPNDDRLRLALFRSIYGHPALERLALRASPPIRIIVENGNVTLEGAVDGEMLKTIARTQASSVSGVFSVTDNLRTD